MQLDDTLRQLGDAMGLGPLKLDANGICRLKFDGGLTVDLEHVQSREALFMHAVVGPAPTGEAMLADMLAANLFGSQTGGAALALDRDRGETMLCREFPAADLDPHRLAAALELFLRALEDWRTRLGRGSTTAPARAPVSEDFAIRV